MVAYDAESTPRLKVERNVNNETMDVVSTEDPRYAPIANIAKEAQRLSESLGEELYHIETEFKKRLANLMDIAGPPNPQAIYEEVDRYRQALDKHMSAYASFYSRLFEVSDTEQARF